MKQTLIALSMVVAGAASAQGLGVTMGGEAELEYNGKTKSATWTAGPTIGLAGVTLKPRVNGDITNESKIDFTGASLKAEYGLGTSGVTIFGTINSDDKFKYDHATVGVNYTF
jgi:hypothetical protein